MVIIEHRKVSFARYFLHFILLNLYDLILQDSQPQQQLGESTSSSSSPLLEDCLKLLKGERDEQRLAGLLLVTKFCKSDDAVSIRRVYDAVGVRFLDRLLRTGR